MGAHPYVPAGLDLPGYVPLRLTQLEILGAYLGTSLFVVAAVWLLSGRCRRLSGVDRLLMCWWAFTGLTHILIEGPFVFTPDFFSKTNPNFFDEVWKEYSKGDSSYAIASRKSYSHILQFAVCLGQLYGCIVYFTSAYLDGFNFWISPFYFWAYFIGANSSWIVIPLLIARRSWNKICAAVHQSEKVKTK